MDKPQPALVALPQPPRTPACPRGRGSWAAMARLAPSIPPWPRSCSLSPPAPGGWWEESKASSCPGRGRCPEVMGKWKRDGCFLQMQPCSHRSGEGSWGTGGTAEPQGHGDYQSKATCQKHPLMDGTGPFGLPGRAAPAGSEGAGMQQAGGPAADSRGSTCTSFSPFPPKPQTVYTLGYPPTKTTEEIAVAVGV